MPETSPPFRAEHIGSLLRPGTLHAAFKWLSAGEIDVAACKAVVDEAIRDVVQLQEDVGLQVVTDGEFRRASYWSHFVEAVEGFSVKTSAFKFHDAEDRDHEFVAPYVEQRIRRGRSISGAELDFLQSVTTRTPKINMPSPSTMHFWRGRDSLARGSYADEEAYFADLAAVYRDEIADLARRGARYIQIDEVPLAMLCDAGVRGVVAGRGTDPARLAERYVKLINDCVAGTPQEVTLGLHLCRGNFKGRWLSEGGYDSVAEVMFGETNVKAFFLEYDNERAGSFAPLRFLPKHKHAVLGIVTTKSPQLEDANALKRRIADAAAYAPLDNLAISPQCGFSSTIGGNPLTVVDQRRKLDLVVRVARDVWGSA